MSIFTRLLELPRKIGLSPVVACTLTSARLGNQLEGWRSLWAQAGIERTRTEDGIRLVFRDEQIVESRLRELVAVENDCCSWASWEVSRERGTLVMRARASGAGTIGLHEMLAG